MKASVSPGPVVLIGWAYELQPERDDVTGTDLVGRYPTGWARPSRLMEQIGRQAFEMVRLGRLGYAASVHRVIHADVLLVEFQGFTTAPAAGQGVDVVAHVESLT